ncbi:MAG TPA: hypothetical protein VKU00_22290 [Chthonomonadaceae bacterium]|nr:hypothetical protein [Chthonomonadaceae bacterium]
MTLLRLTACCAVLITTLLAPTSTQVLDEFKGKFRPDLDWRWDIPQPSKPPLDTFDESSYAFALGEPGLDIVASDGTLYSSYEEDLTNAANLVVKRIPDNWYVETAVRMDWKQLKQKDWGAYEQAALFIARDCDYFMDVNYANSGATKDGKVFVSLNMQTTSHPDDSQGGFGSDLWQPTNQFVKLRIEKAATNTPPQGYLSKKAGFSFWYDRNEGKGWQQLQFTLDKETITRAEPLQRLYKVLNGLAPGWRIGLMANAGGASVNLPARFQYFKTDLEVKGKDGK